MSAFHFAHDFYTATDNHVGYLEKDPIRGNDSVATLEEILQIAEAKKVGLWKERKKKKALFNNLLFLNPLSHTCIVL